MEDLLKLVGVKVGNDGDSNLGTNEEEEENRVLKTYVSTVNTVSSVDARSRGQACSA